MSFPKWEYGKKSKAKHQGDYDVTDDVDADSIKDLLETVAQHCLNSGLLHFWVKPSANPEIADEKTAMDRQMQELIVYKRGSPVPSKCDALRGIDPQSAYCQELVSHCASAKRISATLGTYIESIRREQSNSALWHQLHY